MNRNMKKIVTTLVAFNVVASTVIAVLPTQGFAAENNTNTGEKKLLSTVSATQNLFKNTNFTSTSTNIPDWTVYANQNAEGDATIQTYGTKTTTDWFNYSRTSVRPKGDGSIELYGTANSQIGVTQIINTIPGKSYTVSYNYNTTSFSTIAYLIGTATSNYFSATDVSTGTLNNEKWTSSGGNAGSGRMNYTPWLVGGSGTVNQTFVATGSKTRVFIAAGLNSADKTNVVYQTISGVNITGASAEQLAAPKLNPVKDKDAKVTGSLTGSLDSLKEVQIYKNDVYVGTAKVTGSNYELAVSGSKVGDVYKAYAVDIWGVKSNAASQTVTATAIATPTINEITDKATTATGTGEPGSTLTLKIGDATYTTTVAADGTWSKAITKPKAGTAVEAVSVKDSVTSAKATTTVVDVTAPDAPVLSTVTDADTHVKGTGEAGTTVKVTLPNNATVEGEVDASGNFDVVIPKQAKDAIISAKLTDKAGNVSAAGTTTVVHQGPSAPVLNDVTDKSTTVSGTGEPGDTITVKITDNGASVSYSGKVDDFGEFSIPIDKPSAGAKVEAIAKDPSGALSPKASTTVKDVTAPDAPKVNPVKVDDTKVTGQGEPNCTVKVTLPSGGVVTGTTDDEGNFSVTIPKQTVDKEIKVTLTDASDNESKPTSVTVQADIIAKPTIKEVTTDDTKVSGTGVAGATVTIKANDIEYTGVVAADGTYAITIPKQDVGEAITAKQAKDGASSDTASTTVVRGAIAKTTINSLTTDSTSVSGTAEPNSTVVVKDQKGTQIATGRTGSDGIYSMTIAKQAEGTVVTATATADGKTSSANTTVVRDGIAATTIDTLTADATTATGTAEPNATIVIKNAAGTTIGSGTVGSDGKYSLTIPKQAEGTVVTATATLDGKTSAGSTTVKAGQDIAKTTINALTNDSTTVSGKGEPNATIVVKNGDTTIATGTVGSDGSYSLTIPKQATDSVVTATTTKDGKTSSASTTVTKQATGSVVVTAPYYVGYDS
ncbi:Ig-like domain-containing protein, partial [Listeria rustica]